MSSKLKSMRSWVEYRVLLTFSSYWMIETSIVVLPLIGRLYPPAGNDPSIMRLMTPAWNLRYLFFTSSTVCRPGEVDKRVNSSSFTWYRVNL